MIENKYKHTQYKIISIETRNEAQIKTELNLKHRVAKNCGNCKHFPYCKINLQFKNKPQYNYKFS